MASSSSSSRAFRRTFHIIRALQRAPLDKAHLIAYVRAQEGEDAYSAPNQAALDRAFRDDHQRAAQFGIVIAYDFSLRKYHIARVESPGWLDLPDPALHTLGLLYRSFDDDAPRAAEIRAALDVITRLLPPDRQPLVTAPHGPTLYLRSLDRSLDSHVFAEVQRAVQEEGSLQFRYKSPRFPDSLARAYEVGPAYDLTFQNGHWYLHAFVHARHAPDGTVEREIGHRQFRLAYLQREGLWRPTVQRPARPRPTFRLRYRLHPDLARGEISEHFDHMTITSLNDGWAEVTGVTSDLFHAAQILVRYADKCLVLEPPELVGRIRAWLRGMQALYGKSKDGQE